MGVFQRPRSPYLWIWIPGVPAAQGKNPINTKIPIGFSAAERKENKQIAEQILATRVLKAGKVAAGLPLEADPADVILFTTWAATYKEQEIPKHRGAYRELGILPRLIAGFGDLPITAPPKEWIARAKTWRAARLTTPTTVKHYGGKNGKAHTFPRPSARTVNREVKLLQQMLSAAKEAELIEASPLWGFRALPAGPIRRRMTQHDEEQRLLDTLAADDVAIYLIARDGLVRLGDCLDVRREDDHGRTIDIREPKNGLPITIPVTARLRVALDAVPVDPTQPEWYFPRRRRAKTDQSRTRGYIKAIARACRDATPPIPYGRKVGGVTFHWGTRTTGATRMIAEGGDAVIGHVQKIGGWKDVGVLLEIYQQTVTEDMQRVAEMGSRAPGLPPPLPPKTTLKRVK
jgi:integrase